MNNLFTTERLWLMESESYLQLVSLPAPAVPPVTKPLPEHDAYTLDGGLATVPIHGPIFRRLPETTRAVLNMFGIEHTEAQKAAKVLKTLQEDPAVLVVLLDVDSPGGTVNGTPELAEAVRELSKKKYVYAFTSGQACSAAYWVASQCDGIYAAPSARVGSIGVLLPLLDCSEAYAKLGLRKEAITAGKYKGTGLTGTSLTDEQRALLQQQVNDTWADFKAAVTRRRNIAPEHMEGQTFPGAQARTLGLVDATISTLEAVQNKLRARHCKGSF